MCREMTEMHKSIDKLSVKDKHYDVSGNIFLNQVPRSHTALHDLVTA